MNKRQKHVQQRFIDNEKAVIKELEKTYNRALKDIDDKIAQLLARGDANMQHVIYQVDYQKALKKQISGILDMMHADGYTTISDYLLQCYQDGFIGTLYDLHGQGVPFIFPIDQEAVTRAIQLDSQISQGLYASVGEDIAALKKSIAAEISRGIANGSSYAQIAQQIKARMVGAYTNKTGGALYRAQLIARTEGHRVQVQSAWNACNEAKAKGADLVKQWDAALDRRTRKAHAKIDGEIRELEEPFSNGLMYPGDPNGGAKEVCNCRCAMLQRARWALDDDELETLKKRAEYFGLDKSQNFDDFKKKYLNAVEHGKIQGNNAGFMPAKTREEAAAYARQNFNVDADYSKYNPDVANAVNETMYKIRNDFGTNALDKLNRIGTFPQGYSTRWQGVYVSSTDPAIDGSLWLRNVGTKNSLDKLASNAQREFATGYWSTPEALHTIRHELGHAIHYSLGTPEIDGKLTALRKSIQNERLRRNRSGDRSHKYADWLSEYGFTNTKEFVAESIAEYLAGNPRETAANVVKILIGGE